MQHSTNLAKRGRPTKAVVETPKERVKIYRTASLIISADRINYNAPRKGKHNGRKSFRLKAYFNNKTSTKIAVGVMLEPHEVWDSKNCEVIGSPHKTEKLRKLRAEFDMLVRELEYEKVPFDAQYLMDCFLKKVVWQKSSTLLDGMKRYISEVKEPRVAAHLINEAVVQREYRFVGFIQEFIIETYKRENLTFAELNPAFGERLYTWLLTKKRYGASFSRKIMGFVKAVLNYAVANNWADRNPIAYQTWRSPNKTVFVLNESEMQRLETTPILDVSLSVCRDVFLFQCYTGFAYCDLAELTPAHLFESKENQWFIRKSRNKTNETSIVPLLPRALEILNKYQTHAKIHGLLLPVLSNQKYNDKLKLLAEILGFGRFPLTTHIARKTCATMFLNKGVPLATVAGVLGHATTRTTEQFYAVMREETIVKQVFDLYQNKAV